MNKHRGFLKEIADELNIKRGEGESLDHWKIRVVFSAIARASLVSLWDSDVTEEVTSIIHFKRRVKELIHAYEKLYPELKLHRIAANMSDELYELYLDAGFFYHRAERISPAKSIAAGADGILLLRTPTPDQDVLMSGRGFFRKQDEKTEIADVNDVFLPGVERLKESWEFLKSQVQWDKYTLPNPEFLNTKLPIKSKYWINDPVYGEISLARIGFPGNYIYYLYYLSDNRKEMYQLPGWMVDKGNYRRIAMQLFQDSQDIPPIKLHNRGEVTDVVMSYLLPPEEMTLLLLYSWPYDFENASPFALTMSTVIVSVIQRVLQGIGYRFEEV